MNKVIIIFGPPGSGKGTQAKKIVEKYGLTYFGTGDLIRKEAAKETEYGQIFREILGSGQGKLVPDEILEKFIAQNLQVLDLDRGVVFDGYPRTMPQAKSLKEFLGNKKPLVVVLKANPEKLIERAGTRRICASCGKVFENPSREGLTGCTQCGRNLIQRTDDKAEVIKNRLDVFGNQTQPLLDFYQKEGKIIEVDGNPPIEEVWKEIEGKLDNE